MVFNAPYDAVSGESLSGSVSHRSERSAVGSFASDGHQMGPRSFQSHATHLRSAQGRQTSEGRPQWSQR